MAKKMGRPTKYTKKMGDRICREIRSGKTLGRICEPDDMPHRSRVYSWLNMPSLKNFRDMFDLAVVARTDAWAEQVIDISDDGLNDTYLDDNDRYRTDTDVIQRSKLRVETRLKLMGKVNPRKYGIAAGLTGDDDELEAQPILVFSMRPADLANVKKPLNKSPAKKKTIVKKGAKK